MFKKGDKVFFDSQGTMYEGILVSNVYRVFTEKEIYADIYISAIKEQITVNIKYIKKKPPSNLYTCVQFYCVNQDFAICKLF